MGNFNKEADIDSIADERMDSEALEELSIDGFEAINNKICSH